ncbi:hypothetical protein [uncultured Hymenobacter sp.]|uniref:hypothetical protein n=1 Tax=uncultured Hymenobacter sp. TaxID=170016 RepID=UPI0035CB82CA
MKRIFCGSPRSGGQRSTLIDYYLYYYLNQAGKLRLMQRPIPYPLPSAKRQLPLLSLILATNPEVQEPQKIRCIR